jgi:hypothetical protein
VSEGIKRIKSGSVTDALISATEQAEDMRHVIILYEEADGKHAGFIVDDTFDRATANFLVDKFKNYLFNGTGEL